MPSVKIRKAALAAYRCLYVTGERPALLINAGVNLKTGNRQSIVP